MPAGQTSDKCEVLVSLGNGIRMASLYFLSAVTIDRNVAGVFLSVTRVTFIH